jgi:hypothetical protein
MVPERASPSHDGAQWNADGRFRRAPPIRSKARETEMAWSAGRLESRLGSKSQMKNGD